MLAAAPPADGTDWNVDDVIEASAKLPADAVQAAITEDRGPYEVNKKNLVAMDDANVPETVIDLMIALTYPQRFVVAARRRQLVCAVGDFDGRRLVRPVHDVAPRLFVDV